ncbi:MAG: aminotransferase class III-fold pyridoxal phosphate-dependent enzyme [Myxococcota bacterium]|nr:aminotransferase class III-fold pyridoxal phosphate-dependent enzyme [Myxococcota bacterium]
MSASPNRWAFIPSGAAPSLSIERAEGAYLYTPEGFAILDAAGGAIVSNIGHGRAEVAEAMAQAITQEGYVVPPFSTPSRLRLVDRLRESWLPEPLQYAYFGSGGSDTVDAAIRLARQYAVARGEEGRWKILGRDLSYHGTTVTTLAAGRQTKRRARLGPLLYDWPTAPACYCLRCPLEQSYPDCGVACVDAIEAALVEAGPETVAAVVAEPIGGSTAAALSPPDEYWPRLREICTRHGVLLIADEVMTGFGRTGRAFALDHFGVVPDILVSGKGLAGGYAPICGLFTHEEIVSALGDAGDELMFFTYGALSGSCAAADKVLEIMEREALVARAEEMGKKLRERLRKLEDHPHVAEVRGRGMMYGVEFVKDRERFESFPKEDNFTNRVVAAGIAEGVFFYPSGVEPARDAIMLGPPLVIGDDEIEAIVSGLERALDSAVRYTLGGN